MNVLILKLGATGDVVRTTTLLRQFNGPVTWVTAEKNLPLVTGLDREVRSVAWEQRRKILDGRYDLVINLEDEVEQAAFVRDEVVCDRVFGARLGADGQVGYTEDARAWFDLSLISVHGRAEADRLKVRNRRTYQDLIFSGLGFTFSGQPYHLPPSTPTGLAGDVALSPVAGPVWPMKAWAYYAELQRELERDGYRVNVLPTRASLIEHLADVRGHRCLVSGDSLPMHLALGSGVRCVSLFTCTSPWEIHDYGLQRQIISPLVEEFFYKRGFDPRATTAITLDEVLSAVRAQLKAVA